VLTTLRHALHLIGRDQRRRWIFLIFLAVAVSGLEMVGAVLVFVLLSLVVDPDGAIEIPVIGDVRDLAGDMDEQTLLLSLIVIMAVFFVLRAGVKVGAKYLQYRVAHNAGARLSNRLAEGYLAWPYASHLRRNSAELIRNAQQAVMEVVTGVFIPLILVAAETILTIGLLAVMLVIAPAATALAVVIVGGAAGVLLLIVQPRLKRIGRTAHRMSRDTLRSMQQSLHGIRDIKVLGREHYFATEYGQKRLKLARARYLRATASALPAVVIETALLGFILISFGIAIVGGFDSREMLSILGLFAYVGLRLQPSLQSIIGGMNELKHSTAPLEDIHRDLLEVESLPRSPGQVTPLPFQDALRVESVDFAYEGTEGYVLSGIDLTIRPGEQIGICGPTGGGKTTLVDIIIGLLQPSSGRVSVDGVDIADNVQAWQRNLGVVPQMVFLTDDTLRRNIALGVPDDEIDGEAIAEAVELAQLEEFVAGLPNGLDTTVGERGVRISGGQRQRIAIARALYRRPEVLIFDEGTSALDNATESQLMASIDQLRGAHTIILVAHRLSTVQTSDTVVFMESGRIRGLGSFDALARDNAAFRALAVMSPASDDAPRAAGA
jgi:ATP-binding cassette, subfamily B, bacterial PglK